MSELSAIHSGVIRPASQEDLFMSTAPRPRWGSATDAGRLCVTAEAPEGVDARTYRLYVRRQGAPAWRRRNPTTGVQEYDLDAVVEWNAGRPGGGRRSIAEGAAPRRTDARFRVLDAAQRGCLITGGAGGAGAIKAPLRLDGRDLDRAERYAVTELHKADLIALTACRPGDRGVRLRPTLAGRRVLKVWVGDVHRKIKPSASDPPSLDITPPVEVE
jgi:hypothetical protein